MQLYQEAGADVLYAPGLTSREDIRAVVKSVDRPVNVLVGLRGMNLTVEELSELGVRRVSVGSGFYRAALGAFLRAAKEMKERGTFTFAEQAASSQEISALLKGRRADAGPKRRWVWKIARRKSIIQLHWRNPTTYHFADGPPSGRMEKI